MTLSTRGDAATPFKSQQPSEINLARALQDQGNGTALSYPAENGQTITSKRAGSQTKQNKQSLDYVLRTGLAGGLAGCAVPLSSWD